MVQRRKPIIAANWKMYKTPDEGKIFAEGFSLDAAIAQEVEVVICPPLQ